MATGTIDYEQDTYYVRESREIDGYVKSDQVDELIIVGDTTDYYAQNTPKYTMIGIRKVDADDPTKGLQGAEFNVYSKESCTDESFVTTLGPTDETGYAYRLSWGAENSGSKKRKHQLDIHYIQRKYMDQWRL